MIETGIDKEKLLHYKAVAEKHLRNPKKYRLTVVAAVLLAGLCFIYWPFSKRIQAVSFLLKKEQERKDYIRKVESLEEQTVLYKDRIDPGMDTNQWVQCILDGLAGYDVKLREMESKTQRKIGAYAAVNLSLELQGDYPQLKGFLEWLDQSEKLLRVEFLRIEKYPDYLLMTVQVLGVIPGAPPKKKKANA